ncbi:unnamed protein product [Phytomonas sp. Hart1]|nr:unnamed protein product [Phytomonas sp. Hart1]|eukprot:CCW69651.1 unnamed protein product [Phytomonas sp. isolate Hart1]
MPWGIELSGDLLVDDPTHYYYYYYYFLGGILFVIVPPRQGVITFLRPSLLFRQLVTFWMAYPTRNDFGIGANIGSFCAPPLIFVEAA